MYLVDKPSGAETALIWLGIVASLLVWAAIVVMAGQSGISANFTCAAF
jgi:hypothetical protein